MAEPAPDWSAFGEFQPSQDWSRYGDFKSSGVATAEDVAKSLGIGVAKGVISLAGLPGDVRTLASAATNYLGQKVGASPETIAAFKRNVAQATPASAALSLALAGAPTAQQIQSGVEEVTGEFYKPKTTAGEVAQTVGEFAPSAAAGPGGIVRKAAYQVVAPALATETAGRFPGIKGTAAEPYVRAGAGVATGVVGGLLSSARGADRALRAQLPDFVTDAHIGQAETLIADAAQRGVQLTWPEALSQVTGRPVLTDIQRIAESHPRTRATMNEVVGERPATMDVAARQAIEDVGGAANTAPSTIGPAAGREAEGVVNDVRDIINARTQPFYDAAAQIRLTPAEMQQVRAIPGYPEARDAVRGDPQLNRYVANLPDNSVGFLNEVKKYLDQAASNARAPMAQNPNMQRAAGYTSDAAAARQAAIEASERAAGPGGVNTYEVALNTQQQTRERFLEPLLQGPLGKLADRDITTKRAIDALFPKEPLANSQDEVATAVRALANRNPPVARQLVRAHIEAELENAFNAAGRGQEAAQFAGATFAKNLVGSPTVPTQRLQNLRGAVEALPNGDQLWDGFARFLEIAQATGTRQPIGSRTSFNTQELAGMTAGGLIEGAAKTGLSPGKWFTIVNEKWGQWQAGRHLDELARIITDTRSARDLRRISHLPTGSREAQLISARIIAQGGVAGQPREPSRAMTTDQREQRRQQ